MSTLDDWPEIGNAIALERREVIAKGNRDREKFPPELFRMRNLGLLSVTGTGIDAVPVALADMSGLLELLLFGNAIVRVDASLARLRDLRALDLSDNAIERLPPEPFAALASLAALNVSRNALKELPPLRLPSLVRLDVSHNELSSLSPACHPANARLAEIAAKHNRLRRVPKTVKHLVMLRDLDLSFNLVAKPGASLTTPPKIKELDLRGNPIADGRLKKLVEGGRPKQVLDYLKKVADDDDDDEEERTEPSAAGGEAPAPPAAVRPILVDRITVRKVTDDGPCVVAEDRMKTVRPHVVCCIVRGLRFTDDSFKAFIRTQTRLHEGICEKRNAATIATHDFDKLPPGNIKYSARPPHEIKLVPLGGTNVCNGLELYSRLRKEAEDVRKQKKRSSYSGIHKYLHLLEGKTLYPCLEDSKGELISFPPITNCEGTKMSASSVNMLVEVTSNLNQSTCRRVMDALLLELLDSGAGGDGDASAGVRRSLDVAQMKVVDPEGKLRLVYPSKVDLHFEGRDAVQILRE